MKGQRRNPAPLAGGDRASETVKARRLDEPENTSSTAPPQLQSAPEGHDPQAHPIICRHWFGFSPRLNHAFSREGELGFVE